MPTIWNVALPSGLLIVILAVDPRGGLANHRETAIRGKIIIGYGRKTMTVMPPCPKGKEAYLRGRKD
jgi:hypothetical protein